MNKIETEIISTLEEKLTDALSRESELLGRIKQLEADLDKWKPKAVDGIEAFREVKK